MKLWLEEGIRDEEGRIYRRLLMSFFRLIEVVWIEGGFGIDQIGLESGIGTWICIIGCLSPIYHVITKF